MTTVAMYNRTLIIMLFVVYLTGQMLLYIVVLVALWFVFRWFKERKRVPNKEDKYVYITGCDSGFGNLLARRLDQLGYRVIAGCYTEKGEVELKKSTTDRLTTFQLDVSKSESVAKVAASIKTLVGQKGEWLSLFYAFKRLILISSWV